MKSLNKKKVLILLAVLSVAVMLGGCVSNPDNTSGNSSAGAGYNGGLPWDIAPTIPPLDITPTPDTNPLVLPSPSADANLPLPGTTGSGMVVLPGATTGTNAGGVIIPSLMPTFTIIPMTQSPTSTPRPTAAPLLLKEGSEGTEVRNLQTKLRDLGYMRTVDGKFEAGTKRAVIAFQNRNGLPADGVVGTATMTKLNSRNAVRAAPTPRPTQTARVTTPPRVNENVILQLGSRGTEVRRMQERLIELGYLTGKATGDFNEATEAAVIAFQKRNVSYFDGKAGPLTLNKLYSGSALGTNSSAGSVGIVLKNGDKNSEAVRSMQRRLKDLGYYNGTVDGDFGDGTELAIRSFQGNNGLTVDGKAGETTLNLLNSGNAKRAGSSSGSDGPRVTPVPSYTPITQFTLVTPAPDGSYVTLRPGNMGTLVTNLQNALKSQGYYKADVDGKYGTGTIDAVTRFQADHGLSQDGIAGPSTQRVLFEGNFPIGS